MEADLVLANGQIITMNPSKPNAEAVAIKNGKIIGVGEWNEVVGYVGGSTKIIDLKGKTVIPGLIDAHIHVADFGRTLSWVELSDAKSIEEVKEKIRVYSKNVPKGKWIIGYGWNENNFKEKRCLNAKDLDKAAMDNPVVLYRQQGRVCAVNSKALELAGITKETSSPPNGEIEKDPQTGEPTGILRESATDLLWKIIPEPSVEENIDNVKLAFQKILEAGITSIHWIVLSPYEIQIIKNICVRNDLPLRIYLIIPANLLEAIGSLCLEKESAWEMFKVGGAIIFADGSLAARTAALSSPYKDCPTSKGKILYTQEKMNELVFKVHESNLQLVIHAMGDHAVAMALKAIDEALAKMPRKDCRHRIEQAAVLNEKLIRRMKKLKVAVSVQPYLIISEFSVWSAMDRLGIERARWLYPLKALFREGITVVGGSDCPMEPLNPLMHIKAAVARQFFPEQQITVDEALRMYTINAAYVSFEENLKGSIEKGKLADLTVLSHNPLEIPPNEIDSIRVEMTIVGGKIVYSSSLLRDIEK
ncbi:MAG: amidohydrolase [Candidatus Bathyarchaeia archaeon]